MSKWFDRMKTNSVGVYGTGKGQNAALTSIPTADVAASSQFAGIKEANLKNVYDNNNDVSGVRVEQVAAVPSSVGAAVKSAGKGLGTLQQSTWKTQSTPKTQTSTTYVNQGNQPYVEQLNALYDQIMNRKPFQYDLNGDLLYRQMADQYTQLGQQAMRDTIGQASALTGGYGNSYATTAGNQAYQQYLTQLNNNIPDFYDRALQAWQLQGDELLNQYQLAASHPGYVDAIKPTTYTVTSQAEEDEGSTHGVNSAYAQAIAALLGNGTAISGNTLTPALYQQMLAEWEKEQTK